MNVPPSTIDPLLLRATSTYALDGVFCITSQWGGGRQLWVKRISPSDTGTISVEERLMLTNLKMPFDTPMLVRRKASPTSTFWVCWDRDALLASLEPPHPRRATAPL